MKAAELEDLVATAIVLAKTETYPRFVSSEMAPLLLACLDRMGLAVVEKSTVDVPDGIV